MLNHLTILCVADPNKRQRQKKKLERMEYHTTIYSCSGEGLDLGVSAS
jgi:hypothetical protein